MNKASGSDGIPAELFQILKDDAVKMLHSLCQQIWKTQQWPQDWKRSVFIPIPKKGSAKEWSNYPTITFISHASKICSKSFKLGFSSMRTENFQRCTSWVQRRQRDQRSNCRHNAGSQKERQFQKTKIYAASLTLLKPLTVWITTNCELFLMKWEYQTTLPAS